jgi:hypothetical protein
VGSDETDEATPLFSTCEEDLRGSPEWIAVASAGELGRWQAEQLADPAKEAGG